MRKENQEKFSKKFMGALRAGRHCSAEAAGSAVRTVVTQQKTNCRAE